MTAIREITTVKPGGNIELHLPALTAGDEVEVIVLVPQKRQSGEGEPYSFLQVLEDAKLDGPPDWSKNIEDYLHQGKPA